MTQICNTDILYVRNATRKEVDAMDVKAFVKALQERNISKTELASAIGINRATMYRKMAENGDKFTVKEVNEIRRILDLSQEQASSIFFAE